MKCVPAGLVLVAGAQLSAVLAAPADTPVRPEVSSHHSDERVSQRLSAQEPIVQQASHMPPSSEESTHKNAAPRSAQLTSEPWDDFVETIPDEEEARRQDLVDRRLHVKCNEYGFAEEDE
ncbi:hypothetical protein B0J12DRAFT_701887 [Macrophomina phaseolina]|uniref:Secreted protein n=1 Tax=Macrophomina phaseolina TaxID=35725 RepID=A0ABQ8G3I7_9PEZI|nr:hypothetical protein B0J12DRAFT_701887 [Macrophomina phaseolina]